MAKAPNPNRLPARDRGPVAARSQEPGASGRGQPASRTAAHSAAAPPRADAAQPAPASRTDPHAQSSRHRLERSLYGWKDYQSWAEQVREHWESDL